MKPVRNRFARLVWRPLVSLLVLALSACSDAPLPAASGDAARWARRYLPFEETWRMESEIPRWPQRSPQMVIWEVSGFEPGSQPTAEQRRAADELVDACHRVALERGWFDFKQGLADGYQLMFEDRRHYENHEYILDDRVLDPERPEFLMYYGTPYGKELAGFMFYTRTPEGRGPQLGGNRTLWHYHVWSKPLCMLKGLISVGVSDENNDCDRGEVTHRSPEMMHVWLIDQPGGRFTTSMLIEPKLLKELLAKRAKERPETVVKR
jgi:hypothetical protein